MHLVSTLKAHGFFTALSGIQHVDGPFMGTRTYASRIGYDAVLTRQDKRHMWDHRRVDERAKEFLLNNPEQPWFLSVGFPETHVRFEEPREDEDARFCRPPDPFPDTPETRRDMAGFKASARRLDEQIGNILGALRRSGQEENTLIICTTDHGIPFPGMKCNLYDGGIGVFLILKGPGLPIDGRLIDSMITQMDLYPTLCELLDIPKPTWLEGKSLMPLLKGETDSLHDAIFCEVNFHDKYEPMRAVRTDRWKYIRRYSEGQQSCDLTGTRKLFNERGWQEHFLPGEELYDHFFDPHEKKQPRQPPRAQ